MVSFLKHVFAVSALFTMAMAASPIEVTAQGCHVSPAVIEKLINTTDYAAFDITELAPTFQKDAETLRAWHPETRTFMLSELKSGIVRAIAELGGETEPADLDAPSDNAVERRQGVDERAQYIQYQSRLLSIHDARVRSGRSGCFQHIACGSCVVAAGLTGTAAIITCVGVAVEAEILTAVPTFGVSTAPIWIALSACVTRASAAVAAAIGTCHTLL